jgi:protein-S-isoprenylcysteine O-methyltransferase Ste14
VRYLLWALGVLLIVSGLWPLAILLAIPVFVLVFGAMVIGMALHDEEEYLREKFDIEEKQEDD